MVDAALLMGVLGASRLVEITYVELILLLSPGLYVFRGLLGSLVHGYRVRKIGPLELEPQSPPTVDIRLLIAQQVEEALAFLVLDAFLVVRTKYVLAWLAARGQTSRPELLAYAASIGVPADNLEATVSALVMSGCVVAQEDRISITDFGRRYVARLRLARSEAGS